MTFFLNQDQPPEPLPVMDQPPPTGSEAISASWQAARVRTDHWMIKTQTERQLLDELTETLGEAFTPLPSIGGAFDEPFSAKVDNVIGQVARLDGQDPTTRVGNLPRTREDFEAEVWRRLRVQYDEAQTVLGLQPQGSWAAGIIGELGVGATDLTTLATLPFALEGGPLWRVILGEAVLNAGAEGLTMQRQFDMAEGLDIEPPNAFQQMLIAGATGGALSGAVNGGARAVRYLNDRKGGTAATRPEGVDPIRHEQAVADAEARLTENLPLRSPAAAAFPTMDQFDFRTNGNASPRTNRVGYVFGRLIELGYEPHIAAGLVGNFMQESSPALNTRAIGDNGASFGMGQWNTVRKDALFAFARSRDKDPSDLDTQIAFLDHELKTSEAAAWDRIKTAGTAEDAAMLASQHYWRPGVPHNERRVSYARSVMSQFDGGTVPRWTTASSPADDAPVFTTTRGYTGQNTVTAGDSLRVEVEYELADASMLRVASGEFQPRDRTRAASDEQIAEIAARLDPARLMPSPEADRGAPLVGADGMVESGNGRVAAIRRAYERHPDRAAAYRQEIEALGFAIPEDMAQPILIARRVTELDNAERVRLVREANTSAVARMSPTERAGADARALDRDTLALFEPGRPLTDAANARFVSRALAEMPQAERNALVDAGGRLNAEGERRLNQALFAKAYDAQDIVARYAETDAGELKSLMDALEQAAPEWAAMRADVAAGELRADADITPFLLDAMRLIANARAMAARDGLATSKAINELLDEVDLIEGAISPLTAALVRKFWRNGKVARADDVADFLKRYATEARKIARADDGLFGAAPGPAEILRAVDKDAFADLPDELGQPRGALPEPEPAALSAPELTDGAAAELAAEADRIAFDDLRAEFADIELEMADGTIIKVDEILDDIEADQELADVLDLCGVQGGAA